MILISVIGFFFHKRSQRKKRASFDAEKQQLKKASSFSRSDYTRVRSVSDVVPTLPPIADVSTLSSISPPSRTVSPPTRNTTNATTSSRFSRATEGSSDDTTPDLSNFTIVHPQQQEQQQQQQTPTQTQQQPPQQHNRSRSSSTIYIPYTQASATVSPLARLSTSTLIPLQVQRTQSPENPVAGVTSVQGSLHSSSNGSNGSGVRDAIKHRMSAPPTIILETPSPCVERRPSSSYGGNENDEGGPSSSRSSVAGSQALMMGGGSGSSSTAAGIGSVYQYGVSQNRARSASGSSLPRYYSPDSFDDVALRTADEGSSEGEGSGAAAGSRPDSAEVAPLFGSWSKRPKPGAGLRRSFGP